jgi:acetyl-CoA C-acetyltransferase
VEEIYIIGAKRTPLGAFQGCLSGISATDLGVAALGSALSQSSVQKESIDEVYMGCVLPAGLGQAPARQATLKAGFPQHVPATTVNKVCGSGMKALMIANNTLRARGGDIIAAGGMESMSNAPYLLPKARSGYRLGHQKVLDHMMLDGLEDAYNAGCAMGVFAEATAEKYGFSREEQDHFAEQSVHRAHRAQLDGKFEREIASVEVKTRKETVSVQNDELPPLDRLKKISKLRPAFKEGGTVTAANASSINDGAAALVLASGHAVEKYGLKPMARLVAQSSFAHAPEWFTTAPVTAMQKVLEKAGWTTDSVDVFEINEAFAVVTMAAIKDLSLDTEKVNIFGGACALGHPIGASGARVVVTLLNALHQTDGKRGVASLCIGGGEATAIALERLV